MCIRDRLQRGREAETLHAQGLAIGPDPMTEIFQPGVVDREGGQEEKKIESDGFGPNVMKKAEPTEQKSEESGMAQ